MKNNKIFYTSIILTVITIIVIALFIPFNVASETPEATVEEITIVNTAKLSPEEQIKYVFSENWEIALAVAKAESELKEKATGYNTDSRKTHDRGIFQLNSWWQRDVSDECAYNTQCNIREAYRISKGGTDWRLWYTYLDGKHLQYMQ